MKEGNQMYCCGACVALVVEQILLFFLAIFCNTPLSNFFLHKKEAFRTVLAVNAVDFFFQLMLECIEVLMVKGNLQH